MINQYYETETGDRLQQEHLLMQFLIRMNNNDFLNYLISIQRMLTRYIMIGVENMDILEESVRFIDLLWCVNKLRAAEDQIHHKEFFNDAINNHVDLSPQMREWAELTLDQIKHNQPIERPEQFILCSFYWILNTHSKNLLFNTYNKVQWQQHHSYFVITSLLHPGINCQNFEIEISRNDILA